MICRSQQLNSFYRIDAQKDRLSDSLKLVTLNRNAPIGNMLDQMAAQSLSLNNPKFIEFLEHYSFNSIIQTITKDSSAGTPKKKAAKEKITEPITSIDQIDESTKVGKALRSAEYDVIDSIEKLDKWIQLIKEKKVCNILCRC
jgi:hypothetical protein